MKIKVKKISPALCAYILKELLEEGGGEEEIARFLGLWQRSDRTTAVLAWLSQAEDDMDRRLERFVARFLTEP